MDLGVEEIEFFLVNQQRNLASSIVPQLMGLNVTTVGLEARTAKLEAHIAKLESDQTSLLTCLSHLLGPYPDLDMVKSMVRGLLRKG